MCFISFISIRFKPKALQAFKVHFIYQIIKPLFDFKDLQRICFSSCKCFSENPILSDCLICFSITGATCTAHTFIFYDQCHCKINYRNIIYLHRFISDVTVKDDALRK